MVCALVSVTRKFACFSERREVALQGLERAVVVVLRAVIDVVGDDIERLGDGFFIYVALHHAAVVGGDELAGRRRTRAPARPASAESR